MAERSPRKSKAPMTAKARPVANGNGLTAGLAINWTFILPRAALIVAAGLWVFWPALHGGWLWDDDFYISQNPLLNDPDRLWKIWFEPGTFVEYYPFEATVQFGQWLLWGADTFGYHLTNVVLHLISSLLVWRLLDKFGLRLAWLGGLIFALHPMQVESVAWIVELKNTLSLPPFLLAMCAWIDFEENRKTQDYLLALGLFLVAMLCKISMTPFPLVILLYAWWKRGRIGWRDGLASAPFFVISLVLAEMTIQAGIAMRQANQVPVDYVQIGGFLSHLAGAGLALAFYFSKCFLPVGLLPIYPQWKIDPPSPAQFLPWLVLAVVIAWLWSKRQTWGRHALLGLGFFLLNLAPLLGFTTTSYMSFTWVMDHFLYLPIIGLIGLVVAAMGRWEQLLPQAVRPCGIAALAVVLAVLANGSHDYAGLYAGENKLWTYTVQRNPGAWLAHNNLGHAYIDEGRPAEAVTEFQTCIAFNPDYAIAHNGLGAGLAQLGYLPEAEKEFETSLRLYPNYAFAQNNLAKIRAMLKNPPPQK